jgi:hypothetical protein
MQLAQLKKNTKLVGFEVLTAVVMKEYNTV